MMTELGQRIKQAMKVRSYTQRELSQKIGVTESYISMIIAGKSLPSDRTLKDVSNTLQVNQDWLLTGEGERDLPINRNDEIAKLAETVFASESNSFKERFVAVLANLTEDQWACLESIAEQLAAKNEND